LPVQELHARELIPQEFDERAGQHRAAILLALAGAHRDLPVIEIHVLDPQPQRLR
jgi:hypothetical protein